MDTLEFTRNAHAIAVESKTGRFAKHGPGAEAPFVVVAHRGSAHVVTMFPMNRDPMLYAVQLAVSLFGCDLVAATADAYSYRGELGSADSATQPSAIT